jgi:hypothetical protein
MTVTATSGAVMLGNDLRWHTKANVIGKQLLEGYFKVGENPGARALVRVQGRRRRLRLDASGPADPVSAGPVSAGDG